jgi:hypothetical protein
VDDPLAGYHVDWQDEPHEEDPLEGYTLDWRKKRRTSTAAVNPTSTVHRRRYWRLIDRFPDLLSRYDRFRELV